MNYRFLALVSGLVVSAVVATAPVAGQAGATGARTNASPPRAYAAPRTPDGQPDLQGIWTNATYTPLERPKNVTKEFYTPEEALSARCILMDRNGPPMLGGAYNNDYQIMQAPGYVMILTEMLHDARIIPLDGRPHLPPNVRQWTGSSRGHWEGQTLVVETTNL